MIKKDANWNKFIKNPVAYFCAEFALINDLPTYAGGLGILAGDYILESADQDFPIVGIGLYYQKGQNNKQKTGEPDGTKFGLKLVGGENKRKLLITIPIENRNVMAQVWCWQKKNNFVYFLDTNVSENSEQDKIITEQLYVEDRELRLRQELILGVGGVRLLNYLKITPSIYHLNEGHSAFLIIELLGEKIKQGLSFLKAFEAIKKQIVFTNHTLVLEGQEMFALESLERNTKMLCTEFNINIKDIITKGIPACADKSKPEDNLFSMTALALNSATITNAVSQIHGQEARVLWPNYLITHITNGIYLPRWNRINAENIIKEHKKNEDRLLKLIQETHGDKWEKKSLLIGWSRRFVPYKRPLALLDDITKLKAILESFPGEIHIVYSAPLDEDDASRNEFLKKIYTLMDGDLKGYLTFIPHYRIETAEVLTAGCDIWLNTPIIGREACGTSGMKAGLNGTISVSTNDGWVNETPLNDFGWIIDDQDITESLLMKLEKEIMPAYREYISNSKNSKWQKFMIKSRENIIQNFSTERMLQEYINKIYLVINNN